ncbi:zona pellucida sperm-binding protein 3-like [Mobula birostris]|uniref:zona pellucida sperm-binding protein 3-like n=1 Tax=Mobula birostris TaxID=1983395 RepID=UPI003B28B35E
MNVINDVPKQPVGDSLSKIPTLEEVKEAIKTLKNNKATGLDGTPAEVYKIGVPSVSVMVECGAVSLLVKVHLDLFGTRHPIKASDLTLGTASFRSTGIYPRNHTVVFNYGLHECDSELQMVGDSLMYTTYLNHTPQVYGTIIVRTSGAIVPIQCRYFRKGNVSSDSIKPTWVPFSSTKSGEGHLSFSLRLMNDNWLTERSSTVYHLGELIHIEASVSMINHTPLKIYIDRCVATLSPDKDSTPRYNIIDHHGCLLDSVAEDSFSTYMLRGDKREMDKLRFDLDAFCFFGDERSLIFIMCHLKVTAVDQKDSMNKACTFQKVQNIWTPLENSSIDVCACCGLGKCTAAREVPFPSRGRRDVQPNAGKDSGTKWDGEALLGPMIILDPDMTSLETERMNTFQQHTLLGSPEGVVSEVVLVVALAVTAVSLISATLVILRLCGKCKQIQCNSFK